MASFHLGNIHTLAACETVVVSPENVYGQKGAGALARPEGPVQEEVARIGQPQEPIDVLPTYAARELGVGWKVRPCTRIPAGREVAILDLDGPGTIQHIWITTHKKHFREMILRMYWDGEETPSVEVPLADFFCCGWGQAANCLAVPINVNPTAGFNCYFPMPFSKHARMTVEHLGPEVSEGVFYTITVARGDVGEAPAMFHAQYRQAFPHDPSADYTLVDGITGSGHYVGTFLAWQQHNEGWFGEGEFKAFLDGDGQTPTICGTGLEDYFGGAWCWEENYSAPYLGKHQGPTTAHAGDRHGMYRFHIHDPLRFHQDFRCTMQALGWRSETRFCPVWADISSVVYWYQQEPHGAFPLLPGRDALEIV